MRAMLLLALLSMGGCASAATDHGGLGFLCLLSACAWGMIWGADVPLSDLFSTRGRVSMSGVLLLLLVACTDEDATRDTLRSMGFTDVQTDGHAWFACSDDETFATSFTATNPVGQRVSGAVCCGWLKNCTVRF